MLKEIKQDIAIASACFMLLSGVVLCFLAFFLNVSEHVQDNALWYSGQTMVYAGSVFGLKAYVDGKLKQNSKLK